MPDSKAKNAIRYAYLTDVSILVVPVKSSFLKIVSK